MWGLIDVPSVLLGCYLGYVAERIKLPVEVSRVQRNLPTQVPCYANKCFTLLLGSALTAASMICEAYYLVDTLWHH